MNLRPLSYSYLSSMEVKKVSRYKRYWRKINQLPSSGFISERHANQVSKHCPRCGRAALVLGGPSCNCEDIRKRAEAKEAEILWPVVKDQIALLLLTSGNKRCNLGWEFQRFFHLQKKWNKKTRLVELLSVVSETIQLNSKGV